MSPAWIFHLNPSLLDTSPPCGQTDVRPKLTCPRTKLQSPSKSAPHPQPSCPLVTAPEKGKCQSLSHVWLFATPWTVARRLLCPWDSPGKNTGVGCRALLQGIFPAQGSNPSLLHCRRILYRRSHQGGPCMAPASTQKPKLKTERLEMEAIPFLLF